MEVIERYHDIQRRIVAAQEKSPHQRAVQLLCVSKRQPIEKVKALQEALRAENSSDTITIGENYVQEYREKKSFLLPHSAHLIGALQRNKAKEAVVLFDCIESVHSEKLARALETEAAKIEKKMPVLLQVNISADSQKAGFSPAEYRELITHWRDDFPWLSLHGAMAITAFFPEPEDARTDFQRLYTLVMESFEEDAGEHFDVHYPEISMGMSVDFEIAIEEGATIVRVGSALFGER